MVKLFANGKRRETHIPPGKDDPTRSPGTGSGRLRGPSQPDETAVGAQVFLALDGFLGGLEP